MKFLRYFFYLTLSVFITACASKGFNVNSVSDYEGHFKVGESYAVAGKTYTPYIDEDYKEEGMASWYGPGFHNKKTANGDTFDKRSFTAAHRTLPLPSMVKVTSLETGKDVIVMINDRGPFSSNRIIDLSEKTAEHLGIKHKGISKVKVEYLKQETNKLLANADLIGDKEAHLKTKSKEKIVLAKNTKKKQIISKPRPKKPSDKIFVQVASLKEKDDAIELFNKVNGLGLSKIEEIRSDNEEVYKVYLGPFDNEKTANHLLKKLKDQGHKESFIVSY
jgi:rare lipoprotein A